MRDFSFKHCTVTLKAMHIYCRAESMDRQLIHAIESVVIDWTHQIRDVLKKDSAQPLLEGLHPTPFVEIEFWKNKSTNLECIYEQVCTKSNIHTFEIVFF